MAVQPDTTTGTITLTSGSVNFTTVGTQMLTRGHLPGDFIMRNGFMLVIATITGENTGTLRDVCPAGAAGSAVPVRIRFQSDGSRVAAQTRNLIDLLDGGTLQSLAALAGVNNRLPYFTGPNALGLTALTAFARTLLAAANAAAMRTTLGANNAANLNAGIIPNARIGNDLTPDKAFRRGNALGTVSQSGGVPTGAIVERGSNANGEYIRFLDGSQFFAGAIELDLGTNVLQTFGIPASTAATYLAIVGGEVGSGTDIIRNAAGAANALVIGGELRVRISQPYSTTFVRTIRYFSMNRWF